MNRNPSRPRPRLWPLDLGFVLATCVVFNEVFWGGARLIARDLLLYLYPIGASLRDAWLGNGSFLWDGGIDHGLPVIARWSTAVFYPVHVFFSLVPADVVITVGLLAHIPLAASATMRLALRYASDAPSAWLAGVTFAFSGYVLSMIGGATYLYGAALLPFSLLCFHRVLERPTVFRTIQLALVFALQVFCADPQTLYYETVFVLPAVAVGMRQAIASPARAVVSTMAAGVAAIGLSACQWFPALEFASHSIRAGGLGAEAAKTWSFHPIRVSEFLVPYLFGTVTPENTFWARSLSNSFLILPWAPSVYLGLLPVLATAFVAFGRGRRRIAGVMGVTAFFLVMALGDRTPLCRLVISVLPGADMFRYPEKFMLFVTLGVALLAGAGFTQFFRDLASPGDRYARLRLRAATGALVTLAGAALIAFLVLKPHSPQTLEWFAGVVKSERANVVPARALDVVSFALTRVIALSCASALVFLFRNRLRRGITAAVLIAVAVVDIGSFALSTRVFGTSEWIGRKPLLCETMPPEQNGLKPLVWLDVFLPYSELESAQQHGMRAERQRMWDWNVLKPNVGAAFCVRYAEGYDAGKIGTHRRLTLAFDVDTFDRWFDIAGVQMIIAKPGEFDSNAYPLVAESAELDVSVHQNVDPLPFLHAVPAVATVARESDAVARVASSGFDFRRSAVIEASTALPAFGDGDRKASLVSYRAGRIEVETTFDKPGYLVLLESHYPGWKAETNGNPAPVYRANGAFLGVGVPDGRSRIVLEFAPATQRRANAISVASLAATIALGAVFGRRRFARDAGGTHPGDTSGTTS